jgi:hypothetical protein
MIMKNALLGETKRFALSSHSRLAMLAGLGAIPLGSIRMDAPTLADLETRRSEIVAATDTFRLRMEAGEDLTDEETDEIEANADELTKLDKKIKAVKLLTPQGAGRRTAPEARTEPAAPGGRRPVAAEPRRDDQRFGFRSFGEFAQEVRNAKRQRDRWRAPPAQRHDDLRQRADRRRRRLPDPSVVLGRNLEEGPGRREPAESLHAARHRRQQHDDPEGRDHAVADHRRRAGLLGRRGPGADELQAAVRDGRAAALQADGARAGQRGAAVGRLRHRVVAARQGAGQDGGQAQHRDRRRHRRRPAARHHPELFASASRSCRSRRRPRSRPTRSG